MLIFDPAANGPNAAPSIIDVQLTDAAAGIFTWSTYKILNTPVAARYTNGLLRVPAQYSAELELVSSEQNTTNPIYDARVIAPANAGLGIFTPGGSGYIPNPTPIQIFQAYQNATAQEQLAFLASSIGPNSDSFAPGGQPYGSGPYTNIYALPTRPPVWAALFGQNTQGGNGGVFWTTNYGVSWQIKALTGFAGGTPQLVMDASGGLYLLLVQQSALTMLAGSLFSTGWTVVQTIGFSSLTGGYVDVSLVPAIDGGAVLLINTVNSSGQQKPEIAYYYDGTSAPVSYDIGFLQSLPLGYASKNVSSVLNGAVILNWGIYQTNGDLDFSGQYMLAFYSSGIVNVSALLKGATVKGFGNYWGGTVAPLSQNSGIAQPLATAAQLYPNASLGAGSTPSPL